MLKIVLTSTVTIATLKFEKDKTSKHLLQKSQPLILRALSCSVDLKMKPDATDCSLLRSLFLKMELSTEAILMKVLDTDLELKFGPMVPSTKVSGASIKLMAMVNSGMPMAMCTKVCGKTIKPMGAAFMYT